MTSSFTVSNQMLSDHPRNIKARFSTVFAAHMHAWEGATYIKFGQRWALLTLPFWVLDSRFALKLQCLYGHISRFIPVKIREE